MISKRISTTPFFAAHQNWTPIQRPMRNGWQWSPLTRNAGSTSLALTWSIIYGFQINSSVLLLLKEQEIGRFEQNSQQVWKSISPRFRFKHVHVEGVEEENFWTLSALLVGYEKKRFLSGIARIRGGGVYSCPDFLAPFFYQVTVLKIAFFYSNFTAIVCFLVIFVRIIIKITIIIIIIIIATFIISIKFFFRSYAQNVVFGVKKRGPSCPNWGQGGRV